MRKLWTLLSKGSFGPRECLAEALADAPVDAPTVMTVVLILRVMTS